MAVCDQAVSTKEAAAQALVDRVYEQIPEQWRGRDIKKLSDLAGIVFDMGAEVTVTITPKE